MLDLEAELEVCRKATEGPWHEMFGGFSRKRGGHTVYATDGSLRYIAHFADFASIPPTDNAANMTFVAHARTNYPVALDLLQRIRLLCEKHNQPGVNPGGHKLAGEVLGMINALEILSQGLAFRIASIKLSRYSVCR